MTPSPLSPPMLCPACPFPAVPVASSPLCSAVHSDELSAALGHSCGSAQGAFLKCMREFHHLIRILAQIQPIHNFFTAQTFEFVAKNLFI